MRAELRPEHGPAHATLTMADETWYIREVTWDNKFYPVSNPRVMRWGFSLFRRHAWAMLQGMIPRLRVGG